MYVRVMPSGAICGALARPCSTHSTLTATGRAAQGVDEKARLKLFEREVKELRRPLERRVEAVRPFEQGGRVRGILRHAGGDEPIGASDPDVRLHDRARACVGSGRKRGQGGQALGRSRGGFTTKIHAKADGRGDLIAFDLTGGEASDCTHFETLLDIGPDISPRAAIADKPVLSLSKGAIPARPTGLPQGRGASPRSSRTRLTKRTNPASSPGRSTRRASVSSRASAASNASSASPSDTSKPPKTTGQSSASPQVYA